MADIGLVLVGPQANLLRIDSDDDVARFGIRAESITPLDEDLYAMVGYAASGAFEGPDADRFELLDEASARGETEMLWACSQVQTAGIAQAAAGWSRILVVGWVDEPALGPAVRALAMLSQELTVLLGGHVDELNAGAARRNHTVLADLLRREQLVQVIRNPDPGAVLDIALDAVRSPQTMPRERVKSVDVGPALDLPPTWCIPAAPAPVHDLVHVSMGYARGLPAVAVDIAARRSLHELIHGPPVDIGVGAVGAARGKLPDGDVHATIRAALTDALVGVDLVGSEPLVEQIGSALRPVLRRIREVLDAVEQVERSRLAGVRAFTAAGIQYTVHSLATRLDGIRDPYPSELLDELDDLLRGGAEGDGLAHVTEWRRAFAGIPSEVVPRGTPGEGVARSLVGERLAMFKAEYADAIAERVDRLVQRARDPEAPPSTRELRLLKHRAERIRAALDDAVSTLDRRIERGCDQAVADDRFARWACPEGRTLRHLLGNRIGALPVGAELDRTATEALSRRPLGMADEEDFEAWLGELAREVHHLTDTIKARPDALPTYEAVLLLLLEGRDPPVLRQAIAHSASAEVELMLERPLEPALMNWLTATGMLVVVAPRTRTCAVYWQRAEHLSNPASEVQRTACSEHRLADLVLPPPEGDTVASLVALALAGVSTVVGLVLGELGVVRREGLAVYEVHARGLELPPRTLLPYGAVHLFASDRDRLARLMQRLERKLTDLPLTPDAGETARKLVELATLGMSPALASQLGLQGDRLEHLRSAINALLQKYSELALSVLVECSTAEELARIANPPQRRSLLEVQQLGPSGG